MAIEVKDIKDLVSEYVSEIGNMDKASMHKLWTDAAGNHQKEAGYQSHFQRRKINIRSRNAIDRFFQ